MFKKPRHIGIIPDGNRRWAKQNGLNKQDGYFYGLAPALELLKTARDAGVGELTYYGFTADNCKRPKEQVRAFSKACCKAVELIEGAGASVSVAGNYCSPCFPKELLGYTRRNPEKGRLHVNLLVNYGWEWDMNSGWATREIPRIDMVIRWGGMCRLSGFLPIQTVYSDFYIVKDLWPDYKKEHLLQALEWYKRQDVTLGG